MACPSPKLYSCGVRTVWDIHIHVHSFEVCESVPVIGKHSLTSRNDGVQYEGQKRPEFKQ